MTNYFLPCPNKTHFTKENQVSFLMVILFTFHCNYLSIANIQHHLSPFLPFSKFYFHVYMRVVLIKNNTNECKNSSYASLTNCYMLRI